MTTWEDYKKNVRETNSEIAKDIGEVEAVSRIVGIMSDKPNLEEFKTIIDETRDWAKKVGMTEGDITEAIMAVYRNKALN